jgi:hypothetical protein
MKRQAKRVVAAEEEGTVTFLLTVPKNLWQRFVKTVPISRTRHDFILDLIQRRVWEYEKATSHV